MAKSAASEETGPAGSVEQRIGDFAESLGSVLGAAEKEARSWLEQRKTIGQQLLNIRDTATRLLEELGLGEPKRGRPAGKRGPGRPAKAVAASGLRGKKKRVVSASTRAKMRAAWAKRKTKAAKL